MNSAFAILTILLGLVGTGGLIGIPIALFVAPVVAGPIVKKLVEFFLGCRFCLVVMAILIAGVGGYWAGRWGEFSRGEAAAIAGIARNDAELVGRAKAARSKLQQCQAQGGAWIQRTGECR